MRQFYKKISSVCMALLCVAALLIGCTATAWAADEIDDSVKSQLVTTTKGLTDAIIVDPRIFQYPSLRQKLNKCRGLF